MNELNKRFNRLPTDLQNIIIKKSLELTKIDFNRCIFELQNNINCYNEYLDDIIELVWIDHGIIEEESYISYIEGMEIFYRYSSNKIFNIDGSLVTIPNFV